MLNIKSAKKGEVANLVILGLMLVGTVITLASNTQAATVNCIYNTSNLCRGECGTAVCSTCSNGKYRCPGTVDDSSSVPTSAPTTAPTRVPTSIPQPSPTIGSGGQCEYLNFSECRDDCTGTCSSINCTGSRYRCIVSNIPTSTPMPSPTRSLKCRCINNYWFGDGCDGWLRGKSCGTTPTPTVSLPTPLPTINTKIPVEELNLMLQQQINQKMVACQRSCEEKDIGTCMINAQGNVDCVRREEIEVKVSAVQEDCGGRWGRCCEKKRAAGGRAVSTQTTYLCNTGLKCTDVTHLCIPDQSYEKAQAAISIIQEKGTSTNDLQFVLQQNLGNDAEAYQDLNKLARDSCGVCDGSCLYQEKEKKFSCIPLNQLNNYYQQTIQPQGESGKKGDFGQPCNGVWWTAGLKKVCNNDFLSCINDSCQLSDAGKGVLANNLSVSTGANTETGAIINSSLFSTPQALILAGKSEFAKSGCVTNNSFYFENGACWQCVDAVNKIISNVSSDFCLNKDLSSYLPGQKCQASGGYCAEKRFACSDNGASDCVSGFVCCSGNQYKDNKRLAGPNESCRAAAYSTETCAPGLVCWGSNPSICRDMVSLSYDRSYANPASNIEGLSEIPLVGGLIYGISAPIINLINPGTKDAAELRAKVSVDATERGGNSVFFDSLDGAAKTLATVEMLRRQEEKSGQTKLQTFFSADTVYKTLAYVGAAASTYTEGMPLIGDNKNSTAFLEYAQAQTDVNNQNYQGTAGNIQELGGRIAGSLKFGGQLAFVVADVATLGLGPSLTSKVGSTLSTKAVRMVGDEIAEKGLIEVIEAAPRIIREDGLKGILAISSDLTGKALRAPTVGAERLVGWELPFTSFKPVAALENAAGLIIGAPIVIPSMAFKFTPGLIKVSVTKLAPELLPAVEKGLARIGLISEDVIVRNAVSEFAKSHSGGSLDQGIEAMFSLAKNQGFQGDLDSFRTVFSNHQDSLLAAFVKPAESNAAVADSIRTLFERPPIELGRGNGDDELLIAVAKKLEAGGMNYERALGQAKAVREAMMFENKWGVRMNSDELSAFSKIVSAADQGRPMSLLNDEVQALSGNRILTGGLISDGYVNRPTMEKPSLVTTVKNVAVYVEKPAALAQTIVENVVNPVVEKVDLVEIGENASQLIKETIGDIVSTGRSSILEEVSVKSNTDEAIKELFDQKPDGNFSLKQEEFHSKLADRPHLSLDDFQYNFMSGSFNNEAVVKNVPVDQIILVGESLNKGVGWDIFDDTRPKEYLETMALDVANGKTSFEEMAKISGTPKIFDYGGIYAVGSDGRHRIAVAKALETGTIKARVETVKFSEFEVDESVVRLLEKRKAQGLWSGQIGEPEVYKGNKYYKITVDSMDGPWVLFKDMDQAANIYRKYTPDRVEIGDEGRLVYKNVDELLHPGTAKSSNIANQIIDSFVSNADITRPVAENITLPFEEQGVTLTSFVDDLFQTSSVRVERIPENAKLNDFDNIFFVGLKPEDAERILDANTKKVIMAAAEASQKRPIVISSEISEENIRRGARGESKGIFSSITDTTGRVLAPDPRWRGYDEKDLSITASYIYLNPDKGIVPRDLTIFHEAGHEFYRDETWEGWEILDSEVERYLPRDNRNFNAAGLIYKELKAETAGIRIAARFRLDLSSIKDGKTDKLIKYLDRWRTLLRGEGVDESTIDESVYELTRLIPGHKETPIPIEIAGSSQPNIFSQLAADLLHGNYDLPTTVTNPSVDDTVSLLEHNIKLEEAVIIVSKTQILGNNIIPLTRWGTIIKRRLKPVTSQTVIQAGLTPVEKVTIGDVTVNLSPVYKLSELEGNRLAATAFIEKDGEVYMRTFIKSDSQSTWRVVSHRRDDGEIWFGKGLGGEDTITLPLDLQMKLNALSEKPVLLDGETASSIFWGGIEVSEGVIPSKQFIAEVKNETPYSLGHFFQTTKAVLKEVGIPESWSWNNPNEAPDFSTIKKVSNNIAACPQASCMATQFIANSIDGRINYIFFRNNNTGNVWLGGAEFVDSPINSYGIREKSIYLDDLAMPLYEYTKQLPVEYWGKEAINEYIDASPYTDKLKINQDARLALEKISPFIPPANVEKIKLTNPLAGVVITDSGGFGGAGLTNNTGTTIFIIGKEIFSDKEIRVPIASNRRAGLADGTVVEIGGQRFIFHRDEGRLLPVETGGQAQDLIKEVINNLTLNTGRQSQVTQKVVIGRAEDSDYVLGIFGTSRKHLELRVEEGQLIAEDLNSTYGTYVNGKRITNPTILHSGDKIVVGDLDNHLPISEFIVTEIGVINSQGEIVIEKNY